MTANRTGDGPKDQLFNDVDRLKRDLRELKTNPQPIGNGSINYAGFSPFVAGPFTIPAGLTANVGAVYMNIDELFTWNGLPAINRVSLLDVYYSITIDVDDTDHIFPYGGALTPNQRSMRTSFWFDYYGSGRSDANGEVYVNIQVTNTDSSSHDYYIIGSGIVPRPALKPQ